MEGQLRKAVEARKAFLIRALHKESLLSHERRRALLNTPLSQLEDEYKRSEYEKQLPPKEKKNV
ncbi:hypothetical protein A374_05066 [Fictibacillus macauensis ZFHKF-1]|uniref:Fur-regulated basic protein FbpA n=1 Tax=Fictibacillus macauensis ZFHKF-1 TaxID=1196324 RepID=I8AKC8_9BACL|nr:hypothetical protein [Fictibacillus macauensis]EIT86307.1 hypothetical protein A374_05066 [Fictibacillus macauensis ZFHKF-1]